MTSRHEIRCFDYMNHPYARVRDDTQTPRMPHMGATLDEGEVRAIVEWLKREDRLAH